MPVEQTGVRTLATAVVDKLRCGKKEETKDFTLLSGYVAPIPYARASSRYHVRATCLNPWLSH